jgi:predicted ATPase/DNA-binding CsgD family transcriptional regulator
MASSGRQHPNHLPIALSNFIGRGREIVEVEQLLRSTRLLTLTGPGGCGKTRLALQVAGQLLPDLHSDAWLTEFGPLADAGLVPQAVALALGVNEQPGRSLTETLVSCLESRKALLVFDNCEHLVAACAQLADALLRACPQLRILATSRETLNLAGETVWVVPPLSLPVPQPWRGPATSQEAFPVYQHSEAVRLFVDRATAASPSFTLTPHNGPWVAEICRRLEGMPLAIELAAARVRALSVQQIAERLEHRFHLLVGGSRMAPPRQQSLEATLDWSYALLSPSEQTVLQRLSVFAGGWTLEAAEAVCPGGEVTPGEVVNLLSQLVDKSLVQARPTAGATRYRLLETIRQYAARGLAEAGEERSWRDRQLDFFVDWADTAERGRAGPDHFAWLSPFDAEHDNLRSALTWSLESEHNAGRGLRLAGVMADFWLLHGYHSEGRLRLMAALAQVGSGKPENTVARARALRNAGNLAVLQSDYPAARALVRASLELCQPMGPAGQLGLARSLQGLGDVDMEEGNYTAALSVYLEALTIFQQLHETRDQIQTLTMMGWVQMRAGDYQRAADTLDESLTQCRGLGDQGLFAQALAGRGELAVRQGLYPQAATLLEESLDLRRALGEQWGIAISLGSLGWVALRQHDFKRMRERLSESLSIRVETGDAGGSAWCLEKLAEAALLQGQAVPAARRVAYFQRAARVFGAAATLRARLNAMMDSVDQPEFERRLAELRAALGQEGFAGAWAKGGAMTLEQAADDALAEPESPAEDEPLPVDKLANEKFGGLTARERQVAALIAQGQSNRKIAEAMVVGVRTVETYVTRILSKLDLDSRVQIATWAVDNGLARPSQTRDA